MKKQLKSYAVITLGSLIFALSFNWFFAVNAVGMGGITCAEDAVEFLLAGAAAVQVGTANFTDTSAAPKIVEGLGRWCDAHGVKNVSELTGALALN